MKILQVGEFDRLAKEMFARNPEKSRVGLKTNQNSGMVELTVTDGTHALTCSITDTATVKKSEKLLRWMFDKMVEVKLPETITDKLD